jgi:hypothetical protein
MRSTAGRFTFWLVAAALVLLPATLTAQGSCDSNTVAAVRSQTDRARAIHTGAGTHNINTRARLKSIDSIMARACLQPANVQPVADFTHVCAYRAATLDFSCSFTSTSTDADGTIASQVWTSPGKATQATPAATWTFVAGSYTATLIVTDNGGASDTSVQGFSLTNPPPATNQPPTARLSTSCAPLNATESDCAFNGSASSDTDGTIVTYTWTIPTCLSSQTWPGASGHCTLVAGTYAITLAVTDDKGAIGSVTQSLVVAAPPPGTVPSAAPELPRLVPSTAWPNVTRTLTVSAGGNLQAALDSARRGDEIVIAAGASFTGNFQAKPKPGTGAILVRTSMLSSLPPLGTRVDSTFAQYMPKLITPNNLGAMIVLPGASGWRFVGLEVTEVPTITVVQYRKFVIGDGSAQPAPFDIVLDRIYVHGQPNVNSAGCVALNSGATAIIDSWFVECHGKGVDAQAIGGWNGPGPYLIENNRLEATAENIIFGGADPGVANLVPSDITIRRNIFSKPLTWGPAGTGAGQWTEKNLFELKNARRVWAHSNVLENNWVDGQAGSAIVLSVVNQSGGCTWCTIEDVTFEFNHIDNVMAAFNVSAVPQYAGAGGRRIKIANNLLTRVGAFASGGGQARAFLLQHDIDDLWIEHNTGFGPYSWVAFENTSGTLKKDRFTFRNNIGGASTYNWFATQGQGDAANTASLTSPYLVTGNCIVTTTLSTSPSGQKYVPSVAATGLVNPVWPGGDYSLAAGSACSGAGVNFSTLMTKLEGVR